jgi:hypothetical protein
MPRRQKLNAREKAGIFKLETTGNFGQTEVSTVRMNNSSIWADVGSR